MNFLPDHTPPSLEIETREDQWRNIIAGVVLGLTLAAVFVAIMPSADRQLAFSASKTLLPFDAGKLLHGKTGGDIVVPPPLPPAPKPPVLEGVLPSIETYKASAVYVIDHTTGAVLYKKGETLQRPIASVTKLMSALLILEKSPRWNATTTVTDDDVIDTSMSAGEIYTVQQLWQAALIGSSNKAIITLADTVMQPRAAFVERMNQKALELGMSSTHFTDPSGLDEGNVSTAEDLVRLLSAAMSHEEVRTAVGTKELTLSAKNSKKKDHHMWSTNWLLLGWVPHTLPQLIGGKTGYIPASGYNFVMQVADASGHRLDVVVLGAPVHEERFTDARDIADWVFHHYHWSDPVPNTQGEVK